MQWKAECLRNVGSCVQTRENTDPDFPTPALWRCPKLSVHLCRVNNSYDHVQQLSTPQRLIWKLQRKRKSRDVGSWLLSSLPHPLPPTRTKRLPSGTPSLAGPRLQYLCLQVMSGLCMKRATGQVCVCVCARALATEQELTGTRRPVH